MRLYDTVPDFSAETTKGDMPSFHKWVKEQPDNKWVILFSHPADFTPVCTTELAAIARLQPEFEKRGVTPIGHSCDRIAKHLKWESDVVKYGKLGDQGLGYPIIADDKRNIAEAFDMVTSDKNFVAKDDGLPLSVRSVFLVDQDLKLRFTATYPASTGRDWNEMLRVIDSIKLADNHAVATPHGWKQGDDVVVSPAVSTKDAQEQYGESNVDVVYPYLRIIKQP
jgi:glutaredoxin/glutathione-dependent peroxiredoxin